MFIHGVATPSPIGLTPPPYPTMILTYSTVTTIKYADFKIAEQDRTGILVYLNEGSAGAAQPSKHAE